MRDLSDTSVNKFRLSGSDVRRCFGWDGDGTCGVFSVPSPVDRKPLLIVASSGGGWDHVSVSRQERCPDWGEMAFVKRLFFAEDEIAMQLHVPVAQHVDIHPNCLHLWRPLETAIPLPPGNFV